jgi:hypothetical protein
MQFFFCRVLDSLLRNANQTTVTGEIDNTLYGVDGSGDGCGSLFFTLAQAIDAGLFRSRAYQWRSRGQLRHHSCGISLGRRSRHSLVLMYPIMAVDFYLLPGTADGANLPRIRMSYSLW